MKLFELKLKFLLISTTFLMDCLAYVSTTIPCLSNCLCNFDAGLVNCSNIAQFDWNQLNYLSGAARIFRLNNNGIELLSQLNWQNIQNLVRLTELNLGHNQIQSIEPGTFVRLPNLKCLRLFDNRLTTINDRMIFGNLSKLQELDLNDNRIKEILFDSFFHLSSLRTLRLRRNRIESIADSAFWNLKQLKTLQLDYNRLVVIGSGWMYGMSSLKRLTLRNNQIESIEPNCWTSVPNLSQLFLSNNSLSKITRQTFAKLFNLYELQLSHNRITKIAPHSFHSLLHITELDLSSNRIRSIAAIFHRLKSLESLRLDSNQIINISVNTFLTLPSLKWLDLSGNPIKTIASGSFNSLWRLSVGKLNLKQAQLHCDCHLNWLLEWSRNASARITLLQPYRHRISCHSPVEFANRTFDSFTNSESFECHLSNFTQIELKSNLSQIDQTTDIPLHYHLNLIGSIFFLFISIFILINRETIFAMLSMNDCRTMSDDSIVDSTPVTSRNDHEPPLYNSTIPTEQSNILITESWPQSINQPTRTCRYFEIQV